MATASSELELRLAPMAGVTSAPVRLVARECGAGLLTSEEIDARALILEGIGTNASRVKPGGNVSNWPNRRWPIDKHYQ